MKARLFQRCCRLCLDDTREQLEIRSVERLTQTLLELYNLKVTSQDRCSQNICIECYQDVSESQKWLDVLEKQKQIILANQQHFQEELLEQLGPEPSPVADKSFSPSRSTRRTRRSARMGLDEETTPKPAAAIKNEPVQTRSGKRKLEWEPNSEQESETPTEATSNGDTVDEEEAVSDTTTTTSDAEIKCNKCEASFDDIRALEKHVCEFVCSVCSTGLKYKASLRRHLVDVHKIKTSEWTNYWNPRGHDKDSQSLLVETTKPKKRYRYESDSPTDLEEDSSNDQAQEPGAEIVCKYCGERFDSTQELKSHDCCVRCNICGFTFASRNNVKRHKIRVHRIDPSDPSLMVNSVRSMSRATSRPPSRPPSRAASEHASEDEPLAALATRSEDQNESGISNGNKTPGKTRYRYYCTDCDYSNLKRYRLVTHMLEKHGMVKEQIDPEAIPKQAVNDGSKTPERPKTPATTPIARSDPVYAPIPEPPKTPDLLISLQTSHQPRGRSRSTYQDSMEYGQKRKRSLSACSNKSSRMARSRSIPPPDREVLVAKRRLSTSNVLTKVHPKLRNTLLAMEANRLHMNIRPGCELLPPNQPIRVRASSHFNQEPCPMKKLFKLRAPVGIERQRVHQLRALFRNMSPRISCQSKISSIDVESLVLDHALSTSSSPMEVVEQDPLNRNTPGPLIMDCIGSEQEGVVYEVLEVGTQNVTTVCGTSSTVLEVVDGSVTDQIQLPEQKKKKKNKKEKRRKSVKETVVPEELVKPKEEKDVDEAEPTENGVNDSDFSNNNNFGNMNELSAVSAVGEQLPQLDATCHTQEPMETEIAEPSSTTEFESTEPLKPNKSESIEQPNPIVPEATEQSSPMEPESTEQPSPVESESAAQPNPEESESVELSKSKESEPEEQQNQIEPESPEPPKAEEPPKPKEPESASDEQQQVADTAVEKMGQSVVSNGHDNVHETTETAEAHTTEKQTTDERVPSELLQEEEEQVGNMVEEVSEERSPDDEQEEEDDQMITPD
ncbi:uncharacterized protein LOC131690367 [Topomyia yanbarensis]|uniref:uncharacterized protein LOC131690367 n=1 Tax=Topomyia yanbarensis TaxID=2498891 RepID=UPI00273C1C70|nr:uncharacterized protein LOC131690367 [Topomyia yanbarensis]